MYVLCDADILEVYVCVCVCVAGGVNMRGDQKWPPASNKEAMQAENEARISLAKGPACRPRKVTNHTYFINCW